jgi:ribonuclease Z
MATLHLLGTGAAVSDPHRTTTMLAVSDGTSTIVIDCGGDAIQRLLAAGIDLATLDALIITHEHPDHVSGFPLFMEKIWLAGRTAPLPICGIAPALSQARRCFDTFDTSGWDLPERDWRVVEHEENASVLENDHWRITASPGKHPVPVVGVRIESGATGGVVTYSCDTEPVPEITGLAHEADILVHEANGEGKGHSSMEQAAQVAAAAQAERLLLVHLPPGDKQADLTAAQRTFPHTELGDEEGRYSF